MTAEKTFAVVVAGGRGTRAATKTPKQYLPLGGEMLLTHSLRAFATHPAIAAVQAVIAPENADLYAQAAAGLPNLLPPVFGGESRQASVANGLAAIEEAGPARVLIHDGARPFVSTHTISAVIEALSVAEGAIAAQPVSDTLKRQSAAGGIDATVARDGLWRAQTPQGFRYETILAAHRSAPAEGATDDASLLEADGIHVALVPDEPTNFKLTYKEDFALAEQLLAGSMETRTGLGYDVHRFEEGDLVTLGGVDIPHTHRLKGHSDADVALHALTDALYGALAAGDIGQHFPPSDPQWRGAPSHTFLDHAVGLVRQRGGQVVNLDLTLICEAPKIGPHREAMAARIAEICGISASRVAVKATTTEGLGFAGRQEGIAAQAVATIRLPTSDGDV